MSVNMPLQLGLTQRQRSPLMYGASLLQPPRETLPEVGTGMLQQPTAYQFQTGMGGGGEGVLSALGKAAKFAVSPTGLGVLNLVGSGINYVLSERRARRERERREREMREAIQRQKEWQDRQIEMMMNQFNLSKAQALANIKANRAAAMERNEQRNWDRAKYYIKRINSMMNENVNRRNAFLNAWRGGRRA